MTPLLLGLLLGSVAMLRHRRWLVLAAASLIVLALATMTPLVANALVGSIESRAQGRPGACEQVEAVVFLSGGLQHAPVDDDDVSALTADSVARVFGLLRRGVNVDLPLVISGGGPFTVAESNVIATLMRTLGIPREGVILEPGSRTTWDSAFAVRALLPREVDRIALASSALHLPRATVVYEVAGFTVCPWALSARWQPVEGAGALLPGSSGLLKSEAALHEIVGTAWYRLRLLTREEPAPVAGG